MAKLVSCGGDKNNDAPPEDPHEVLEVGAAATVYAIKLKDGSCPVTDWLDTLDDRQYSAVMGRVKSFAERGWLKNPDAFRNLEEKDGVKARVDEIKHTGANLRLYVANFSPGDKKIYATHGTTKPKKNKVSAEVSRARDIHGPLKPAGSTRSTKAKKGK